MAALNIHSATCHQELEEVQKLLTADSALAYKVDEFDKCPIHYAAEAGFKRVINKHH